MDGQMPRMPSFPKLAKKPGCLRGYVKNAAGKPLAGAKIMVTSSAVGGFGTSASAETNEQGYYEVKVPYGVARVWCAGYAVTYHGVRIANSLKAADGKLADFVSREGAVENFVFLPYGIVDEASVSDNPVFAGGYFGASFILGYWLYESGYPTKGGIEQGATVEVTLTPQGPLIDGSTGRPITIRKKLDVGGYFQVNNVPVGRYTIAAKLLHKGKWEVLRLEENVRRVSKGGLTPKKTDGPATVLFRSSGSDPGVLRVSMGNMERLELFVSTIETAANNASGDSN
jgi:hypothetical protein